MLIDKWQITYLHETDCLAFLACQASTRLLRLVSVFIYRSRTIFM